ncbi:MAG: glycoside hydrolase [Chloroflexi bacterium]|nr:glycoside hydrolase [Chloroflexota bacterium]
MRQPQSLFALLVILSLILGACVPAPVPTATAVPPTVAPSPTVTALPPTVTAVPTPAEEPIYLALIWHQHQPVYYKDPATGVYAKPWVRVHAAKDYVDMATTVAKYPKVKATFNITPSLIRQLDDLAAGAKDLYQVMAEKPAVALTADDKAFIEQRFFDTNSKIIARFPRYKELADSRKNKEAWTEGDWRDLQVLFNLAWTDPDWLAQEPLKALVEKGKSFTEADKKIVFDRHLELVKQVVPVHKQLQDAGQIEVTMTPYAHPILPLLYSTQLAKLAVPDITLPAEKFVAGQDGVAQLKLGVQFYQQHFGRLPVGMWPAEGAVAQEIVGMVSRAGLKWMASDEEVLAKSLGMAGFARDSAETVKEADALYRPYDVTDPQEPPVAIIFRDKNLSDKVGFTYSGMKGDLAAQDFVRRVHEARAALKASGKPGPHLLSVILDGENAWEYYDNDGKLFLNTLYQLLSEDKTIVTVTPGEFIAQFPKRPALAKLWAGSWVTPDYKTWIGEEEENTAWDYLARTRALVTQYEHGERQTTADKLAKALDLIYTAEGSDWFWWYGADQNSGNDEAFDEQFSAYLGQVYDVLGEPRPIWLGVPIIARQPEAPETGASALIAPTIDGRAIADDEWLGAGRFVFQGGTMASSKDVLDKLYYGFDGFNLYLRVDAREEWAKIATDKVTLGFYLTKPGGGPANAFSRYGVGQTLLGFGSQALVEVVFDKGKLVASLALADGANQWGDPVLLEKVAAAGKTLELQIPFEKFGQPDTGDQLKLRAVLSIGAADQTTLPAANPALVVVPDLGLSTPVLTVEDPEGDDKGPGSYTYPLDPVFPGHAYDIKTFEVAYDEKNVLFKLTFYGALNNAWGAPNGMGVHTVDIYIDQDGKEGSGQRKLLPGRNAAVSAADAWDLAIWAEGWTPELHKAGSQEPEKVEATWSIAADPGQRKIIIKVPKKVLAQSRDSGSDKPETWKYLAVVLSQEGYPASGVWRVRDVMPASEQWRLGGAPADTNHTRIVDVALPQGADQFKALSTYKASAETDMDKLGPDDFAQLPMVRGGK